MSSLLLAGCALATPMAGACELATEQVCSEVLTAARDDVGIPSGDSVRIVKPLGSPGRTAPDVGLVIVTDATGSRHLILVGYVGIDRELHAWIPDPTDYRTWYEQFGAT
ncbi:MAG TPA: hypothetical protein VF484_03680 [Candidatus Limnocylindrales bacterium]